MAEADTATLDCIEMLAPLDSERRAALARRCKWRRCGADEQIIDHLSDTRDVCFVVRGRVRVVNHSASGREISFDDVNAGGHLGELAAIDGGPRSASVVALDEGTLVAFLAPQAFRDIVTGHPDLALAVMTRLCRMVRLSTDRIMDLSVLGANERVRAELLRMTAERRVADGTATLDPAPVHADIASRVSTTRETVTRVLGELTRDGLIERRGHALVIRNVDRLAALVQAARGES